MYISHIKIKGFRNFKDSDIEFNDGLNVLIGHNNAGKTNLLKALQLVIEPHYRYRRLNANDFNRDISLENLKSQSPSVTISVTFKNSNIEYNEQEEDLRVVANWFTDIESGYAAMLTYRFYLPAEKEDDYKAAMADVEDIKNGWSILENDFLRGYVSLVVGAVLFNFIGYFIVLVILTLCGVFSFGEAVFLLLVGIVLAFLFWPLVASFALLNFLD